MFLDCLFDPLDYLKQVSFSVRLLNVWTSLLTWQKLVSSGSFGQRLFQLMDEKYDLY